jgi:hypothetical protein
VADVELTSLLEQLVMKQRHVTPSDQVAPQTLIEDDATNENNNVHKHKYVAFVNQSRANSTCRHETSITRMSSTTKANIKHADIEYEHERLEATKHVDEVAPPLKVAKHSDSDGKQVPFDVIFISRLYCNKQTHHLVVVAL